MFSSSVVLVLSILAAISAALTITAQYRRNPRLEYVCKPLTTALIIAIALLAEREASQTYQALILLGLLASLAGDVFLMLPQDRFVPGLVSFLIAHIFYISAFTTASPDVPALWYGIPFVLYGVVMLWRLWPDLGSMRAPVMIYVGVILVMAWQAANRWIVTRDTGPLLALIGAYLFVLSDSVLAVERFRGTFRSAPFWVLSTYFAAQWLIALSI